MEYKNNQQNDILFFEAIALLFKLFGLKSKSVTDEASKEALEREIKGYFKDISAASPEQLKQIKSNLESNLDIIREKLRENKGVSLSAVGELMQAQRQEGILGKTTTTDIFKIDGDRLNDPVYIKEMQKELKARKFFMPESGVNGVSLPVVITNKNGMAHIINVFIDLNADKSISS